MDVLKTTVLASDAGGDSDRWALPRKHLGHRQLRRGLCLQLAHQAGPRRPRREGERHGGGP
jgi:hypothetical protein